MVGLLITAGLVVWQVGRDTSSADLSAPISADVAGREQRAVALLEDLPRALRSGRLDDLAGASGEALLADISANVREIGFGELDFRFIAPVESGGTELTEPDADRTGWVASVQVSWRFETYDRAAGLLEVPIALTDDGTTARFAGLGPLVEGESRAPAWMLERLAVRKSERTLVLAASPQDLERLDGYARAALPVVSRVLPEWDGSLVVVAPSSRAKLDQTLGTSTAATALLAGVTAAIDGSSAPGTPLHVLLNPEVFDALGPQAAQIVVSHEAAHVATDGAFTLAPPWLIEGFADYVALRNVELPVEVSAGQALTLIRRNGTPDRLPDSADFAGSNSDLGAVYELAWLAVRSLASRFGEDRMLEFYRAVDGGVPVDRAFVRVLGTTTADFTRGWRMDLAALASTS